MQKWRNSGSAVIDLDVEMFTTWLPTVNMFTTKSKSWFGGPYSSPRSSPITPFMTAERTVWLAAAPTANPTSSPLFGWSQSWAESDTGRPPARPRWASHILCTNRRERPFITPPLDCKEAEELWENWYLTKARGVEETKKHTHTHRNIQIFHP